MRASPGRYKIDTFEIDPLNHAAAKALYAHMKRYNYNKDQHQTLFICAIDLLTTGNAEYPEWIVDWDIDNHQPLRGDGGDLA